MNSTSCHKFKVPFGLVPILSKKKNIEVIENATSTRIQFLNCKLGSDKPKNGEPVCVTITGKLEQIRIAKSKLEKLVKPKDGRSFSLINFHQHVGYEDDDEGQEQPDLAPVNTVGQKVVVPSNAVGFIVGKGGKSIKEVNRVTNTQTKIVSHDGNQGVEIEIKGPKYAVNAAKRLIEKKVDSITSKEEVLHTMRFPKRLFGLLIGTGGANIKAIMDESGAFCEVKDDPNVNVRDFDVHCYDYSKAVVNIKGNHTAVRIAKILISAKLKLRGIKDAVIDFNPGPGGFHTFVKENEQWIHEVSEDCDVYCKFHNGEGIGGPWIFIRGNEKSVDTAKGLVEKKFLELQESTKCTYEVMDISKQNLEKLLEKDMKTFLPAVRESGAITTVLPGDQIIITGIKLQILATKLVIKELIMNYLAGFLIYRVNNNDLEFLICDYDKEKWSICLLLGAVAKDDKQKLSIAAKESGLQLNNFKVCKEEEIKFEHIFEDGTPATVEIWPAKLKSPNMPIVKGNYNFKWVSIEDCLKLIPIEDQTDIVGSFFQIHFSCLAQKLKTVN